MPRLSRFQIMQHVRPMIEDYFRNLNKHVFSFSEIAGILFKNRAKWTLANITTTEDFIEFLIQKEILFEKVIKLKNRITKRYVTLQASPYEIALTINKNSYLSHYTSVFIHGLTDNVPKTIYTNMEQHNTGSYDSYEFEQINIDRAFSRPMRMTNQIAEFDEHKVFLLNGKNVGKVGVVEILYNDVELLITNIERTLIDITVRPNYAGGISEILNTFIEAKGKFSTNKLVATLKEMDFAYPYHQAIGFYMEHAGYSDKVLKLLENIPMKYNFFLTYQMKEKKYSDRWKLYYPMEF